MRASRAFITTSASTWHRPSRLLARRITDIAIALFLSLNTSDSRVHERISPMPKDHQVAFWLLSFYHGHCISFLTSSSAVNTHANITPSKAWSRVRRRQLPQGGVSTLFNEESLLASNQLQPQSPPAASLFQRNPPSHLTVESSQKHTVIAAREPSLRIR